MLYGWFCMTAISERPAGSVRPLANGRSIRIDDHGSRVIGEVWALYREALVRFGPVPSATASRSSGAP